MSKSKNTCDFFNLSFSDLRCDRTIIAGRRGTGKTTGIKRMISNDHVNAVWCTRSKNILKTAVNFFIPPAVADKLPTLEILGSQNPDTPCYKFGGGCITFVAVSALDSLRVCGVSVNGRQPDLIVLDEFMPPSGRITRAEPRQLIDFAVTCGRSGKIPQILIAGNPIPESPNNNPYSIQWRVDLTAEGVQNGVEVIGTGGCRDCFGQRIGIDAGMRKFAPKLNCGGSVVGVNGSFIRIRSMRSGVYVGMADTGCCMYVAGGKYTPFAYNQQFVDMLRKLRYYNQIGSVIFDSFDAELLFYCLLCPQQTPNAKLAATP